MNHKVTDYNALFEVKAWACYLVNRETCPPMRIKTCGCVVRWNPKHEGKSFCSVTVLERHDGCSRKHKYLQEFKMVYVRESDLVPWLVKIERGEGIKVSDL